MVLEIWPKIQEIISSPFLNPGNLAKKSQIFFNLSVPGALSRSWQLALLWVTDKMTECLPCGALQRVKKIRYTRHIVFIHLFTLD
jgi:hypothetical protein